MEVATVCNYTSHCEEAIALWKLKALSSGTKIIKKVTFAKNSGIFFFLSQHNST